MARLVDGPVDALVEIHQVAVVPPPSGPEHREQVAQLVEVDLGRPLGCKPRGLGLEHRAHLAEPGEIAHVDGGHEDAAPREHLDEPLLR